MAAGTSTELRYAYQRYVTTVSHPQHAVSIQLAFYMWDLLDARRPQRVADLGSGFSSYVLRMYAQAKDRALEVWSVDDDAEWIERTRSFLAAEDLSTERLVLWEDFAERDFDLVLHDLGTMPTRAATLTNAISMVRKRGVAILDDLHMPDYRRFVLNTLTSLGIEHESAEAETRDVIGRYSWIALP